LKRGIEEVEGLKELKIREIHIEFLADRPDAIPILKEHFESEWSSWYGPGEAEADLRSFMNRSELPVGVIAISDGQVVGIAALKPKSIDTHEHLGPWVAAGWVRPELRGQGIGASLVGALEELAHELGFGSVYCGTSTANSLLLRLGWQAMETIPYHGEQITLYRKAL
jgi:predicted N-acetyltransferase YhbS